MLYESGVNISLPVADRVRQILSINKTRFEGSVDPHVIPIKSGVFAHPEKFTRYPIKSGHRAQARLDFYRVYLGGNSSNTANEYCAVPTDSDPISFDAHHSLRLFSDFSFPSQEAKLPPLLAVCGFDVNDCLPAKKGIPASSYDKTLSISQFQTTFHKDEKAMIEYLGFIRYKELFTHIVEQLALYMRDTFHAPLTHVTLQQETKNDWKLPWQHLNIIARLRNPDETEEEYKKEVLERRAQYDEEMERIYANRSAFAEKLGYTEPVIVSTIAYDRYKAFAKPLEDIYPDASFQAYLAHLTS